MAADASAPSPFERLGMAPTLDIGAIKRAYFTALSRHPPHSDPEGFRRVREAYERLGAPAARMAAYLSSPVDIGTELSRLESWGRALADTAAQVQRDMAAGETRARIIETLARMPWSAARDAFDRK